MSYSISQITIKIDKCEVEGIPLYCAELVNNVTFEPLDGPNHKKFYSRRKLRAKAFLLEDYAVSLHDMVNNPSTKLEDLK